MEFVPAVEHPCRVDGESFRVADAPTRPKEDADKEELERALAKRIQDIAELQQTLYASNRHALLLVFQAMDAAGKDSTIRAVTSGVNPAGFQVYSFKQPSTEELDHDFLWRTACRLPERGRIGVFNRSYYEEVLVVRVHPEYLAAQRLPVGAEREAFWKHRLESIREHERHLARSGTVILKFWLNVSREEQRRRFLKRLRKPHKQWKFSMADVEERRHWDAYMNAYEDALRHTSRPWAPWFAVPADDKPHMRLTVASIVADTLRSLDLRYPTVDEERQARFSAIEERLKRENDAS